MENFDYIKNNYLSVCEELQRIADSVGTPVPKLVAVTKSGSDDELIALCRAGASDIGENRPGEVKRRFELLSELGLKVNMHEIGTLQRNKIKLVAPSAAMIHSVDSLKLAEDIGKHALKCGRTIPVLIEVNSGREENKDGIMPEDAEAFFEDVRKFPHLEIRGLMTMGPVCEDPEEARKYFRLTREIFDKLREKHPEAAFDTLSMGMSDSYRVAIEEGSTLVRVGRKLFIK